jgi:serine-type D-Ala-D-Ala carboxypeptidase/endopeptidase (penicillin-binding protein 4)
MPRIFLILLAACLSIDLYSQDKAFGLLLSDSAMLHASVSFCVVNADNGTPVFEYNSDKSLAPASVMKVITTATALELLGPQYTFTTVVDYTGTLNNRTGQLSGNIIIRGGGDPCLGSKYFSDHYGDFIASWITEIKKLGIKKIEGRIITDDSYYDYQPVPSKWLWEDEGNYYGAGVYGLSVFDNTYEIHFKTASDSSKSFIKGIVPSQYRIDLTNSLITRGTSDEGYVFTAPYGSSGWLAGSIPVNMEDFVLKASITDPPLLLAKMLTEDLQSSGISVSEEPTTVRLEKKNISDDGVKIVETVSPALSEIIDVLNHESVNLFAEHLVKELGKKYRNSGSTASGIDVILEFLRNAGIKTDGIFMEDGSGLSPVNSINTRELVNLLFYMRNQGKYFPEYFNSLPDPGKQGTLKYNFTDHDFENRIKAKSGSMTRVRSYAGYLITLSGKPMIFGIIINNFSGPSKHIITGIEEVIKEIIMNK